MPPRAAALQSFALTPEDYVHNVSVSAAVKKPGDPDGDPAERAAEHTTLDYPTPEAVLTGPIVKDVLLKKSASRYTQIVLLAAGA